MSTKFTSRIAALTLASVSMFGAGALVAAAPAVAASAGTVSTGSNALRLNVRSKPTTASKVVGSLKNGQRVTLSCWVTGQRVNGRWGATSLWHKIGSGYVSDGFLYTGINGPAKGEAKCGATSKPAPAATAPASKPSATLSKRVDSFKKKWTNRAADFDGRWGAQCVDLFNFYNRDVVGGPFVSADFAKQLYANASTARYTKLAASATPRKGDVAIWGAPLGWVPSLGVHAGHVAIVMNKVNASTVTVFDQNNPIGHKPWQHNASTAHLIGYLRPKV